ncbi:ATP-binding cassette domain-containing protein [Roseicitreum antarcticum]|uniref:D-xylose transport system ATP-binding protein n=1 Tax=Roseicitreum antarcticum TaxID=564137 RepID=A0A1H2Z3T1_9RHOB|nr:ATP-binding cassette domain-containing protein [Roseicitreum antarcticum]SDX12016.1 D-xylose transport system ATP-binding protein [Roseicitreum antarcticum]
MSVVLRGISKSYGAIRAIENIDLTVEAGEVIGLLGDNGAGKSTLMKVLAGAVTPNAGTIEVDGAAHVFRNSSDASAAGIAMLYQDLALFDDMPVVHNIFLGREMTNALGFLKYGAMRVRAQQIVNGFSVRPFDVRTPAGHLSGGQRQVSALARTTAFGSRYIILDEPTSALSPSARDEVLGIVRDLADSGIGIVMVSHDLGHVRKVCDRVAILHLGNLVGVRDMATTTQDEIISLIVQGHA